MTRSPAAEFILNQHFRKDFSSQVQQDFLNTHSVQSFPILLHSWQSVSDLQGKGKTAFLCNPSINVGKVPYSLLLLQFSFIKSFFVRMAMSFLFY